MNPITLYLIRHAEAETRSRSGHDHDRALTPKGHEQARRVADALALWEAQPTLVLTSPWLRARETAAHLQSSGNVVAVDALASGNITGTLSAIADAAASHAADTLAVVGHEPWMSQLGSLALTGNDSRLVIHIRKASVLMLSGRPTPGLMTLEAFVPVRWLP
jgi:phosphohistidine phosphatase